jgi:hypothetical protein
MPFDVINTGTTANDGTGDPLRTAFTKVNDNTAKAVEGPASATADAVALYDSTTGKLLKDGPVPGAASGLATLKANGTITQPPAAVRYLTSSQTSWLSPATVVGTATAALANGALRGLPWYLPFNLDITAIGILVTTAGAAGSVIRLGAYIHTTAGLELHADYGTVDSTTTGEKIITVVDTLPSGMCVLVMCAQGTPATEPSVRASPNTGRVVFERQTVLTRAIENTTTLASYATGVTGALPSTSGNFAGASGTTLGLIAVRAKATYP